MDVEDCHKIPRKQRAYISSKGWPMIKKGFARPKTRRLSLEQIMAKKGAISWFLSVAVYKITVVIYNACCYGKYLGQEV